MNSNEAQGNTVMQGFPPRPQDRIGPTNWFNQPFLRWSLMNRSVMVPTVSVWRGDGPVSALPALPKALDDLPVTGLDGQPTTLLNLLPSLEIDGFMVLHRGQVVYERYFHGMQAHTVHGSASVSKSFLGVLAGILADRGVIDLNRTAEFYVPEMKGSAMGDATLRQLMDMLGGIVRPSLDGRTSDLGSQDGGVYELIGLMPKSANSPADFYEFILRKPPAGKHGEAFYYDNGQPEAVAWAIRRATGRSIADLMSELIFAPLGMARDGFYSVDQSGAEFTSGGLALTLGDMARFAEMLRCEGRWNGRQIVPAAFIADVRAGGDPKLFAPSRFAQVMPGGSYRSFFWNTHDDVGGYMAIGRYGQRAYVSPRAELVIAQFSSVAGPPPHPFDKPVVQLQRDLAHHFIEGGL